MAGPGDPLRTACDALASHHPTWRHALLLWDLLVDGLGESAVVDTANAGALRWLYRREAPGAREIVPWPVATLFAQSLSTGIVPLGDPDDDAPWRGGQGGAEAERTSRLRGLRAGRMKVHDGRQSLELGYGDAGHLRERSIGGLFPGRLEGLTEALAGRGSSPAERAAAFLLSLDPGRHGPARARLPVPIPGGLDAVWAAGRAGVRRALFDGRVPHAARFVVVDGVAGTAVGWGVTLAEAEAAYEAAVRGEQPRPSQEVQTITDDYDDEGNLLARGSLGPLDPDGDPDADAGPAAPEIDPVTGRVDFGMMVLRGPSSDVPLPDLTLATTPTLVVPLAPFPPAPPPFGRWVRTLGALGSTTFAARVKEGDGFLLIGERLLPQVDRTRLLAQLEEADERLADALGGRGPTFPEIEPFVRFTSTSYRWAPARESRPARFESAGSSRGPRFDAAGLEGEEIAERVYRHLRVRRGSR